MDLPADVLEVAHDDGGAVLPQEEHIVLPKGPKYKLFKRLVIIRIIAKIIDCYHFSQV